MTKKAILMSIKPKWCDKIASGEKTIEVRKTRPKLETPFKCYIYCTKPSYPHEDFIFTDGGEGEIKGFYGGGKVIGEFVCDEIYDIDAEHVPCLKEAVHGISCDALLSKSCLSAYEMLEYLTAPNRQISIEYSRGYGWHISDLKIYDEPKGLNEFHLKKPFQSWGYIEDETY